MSLRAFFCSIPSRPVILGAPSLGLLLLLAPPAYAESAPWEVAPEVAVEAPAVDGGSDGPEAGIPDGGTDGTMVDTSVDTSGPTDGRDGTSGEAGVDMALGGDAPSTPRDAAPSQSSSDDGDCGCRVGGASRGTSGTLSLLGAVGGVLLVARRMRRRTRRTQ